MDKKDADAAAADVGRGTHPNQLKGDLRLMRDLTRLPPPLPNLEEENEEPGEGNDPAA
jgi:hypothetical protein